MLCEPRFLEFDANLYSKGDKMNTPKTSEWKKIIKRFLIGLVVSIVGIFLMAYVLAVSTWLIIFVVFCAWIILVGGLLLFTAFLDAGNEFFKE
jgi:uncharacterized membrane protein